ncbi:MAG: nitronate monooxygenase [Methylococcales bacterium]|nr:nitronate monooxygenase [Methylococcales bacterium]MDD5630880.1 nitronate monooxygenase [Methylococcales bacterium]
MATQFDSTSWTRTGLTTRLGIDYPIIQGPLGGLSSQRLTAAVSNFGGLGSFGAHGLGPDEIRKVIREIRFLTSKPVTNEKLPFLERMSFLFVRHDLLFYSLIKKLIG